MGKIARNLLELIGNTPLVELGNFSGEYKIETPIIAKLEYFNPGGSVKDRIALAMIEEAEKNGALKKGGTIIEPTSGNTGIGLAMVAAIRNYRIILTMPETMSVERRKILQALGAEIVLTPGSEGMKGAIAEADILHQKIEGSIIMGQFNNPANPAVHERNTAVEIWEDTGGRIDIFVAGVGTGGTVSGVGRRLKEFNPAIKIVAVEPAASPVLAGGSPGAHKIQGIGAGFIPTNFDPAIIDEVIGVNDADAFATGRELARTEGLLTGISSGAAMFAARTIAAKPENRGKRVVALLPDTGERYLSTLLFDLQ